MVSAANRYLLVNRADAYVPLYRTAYQDFPDDPGAGSYHWKVAFRAYLDGQSGARICCVSTCACISGTPPPARPSTFWRAAPEQANDFAAARTLYARLSSAMPNTYYAVLARARMLRAEVAAAGSSASEENFLRIPRLGGTETGDHGRHTFDKSARIERSRLLRTAGLADLADSELRFGARNGGQPALLAMEMAGAAEAPHLAMRIMKSHGARVSRTCLWPPLRAVLGAAVSPALSRRSGGSARGNGIWTPTCWPG